VIHIVNPLVAALLAVVATTAADVVVPTSWEHVPFVLKFFGSLLGAISVILFRMQIAINKKSQYHTVDAIFSLLVGTVLGTGCGHLLIGIISKFWIDIDLTEVTSFTVSFFAGAVWPYYFEKGLRALEGEKDDR
jgi:uncharacterized membrane protein